MGAGSRSRSPPRRPTSGPATTASGVALELTNRVELEVRGWSRGEIELTVDGEGSGELTDDRENRFVRGLEAALVAGRGELPTGVGWRIGMQNRIPLARGLGSSAAATVAGHRGRQRPDGRAAGRRRPAAASRPRSRATPTTPPRRCSAGSSCRPRRRTGVEAIRFDVSARPARRPVHPGAAAVHCRDAPRAAEERAAGGRRREPRARWASGWPASRPAGRTCWRGMTVDRLHEPYRAKVYPAAAAARRRRPRGRRPRGVPVGRRLDDPRLRRLDDGHLQDRGRARGRRGGHRPRGPDPRRRAPQRGGKGGGDA